MHDAELALTWPQPAPVAAQPFSAHKSVTHAHASTGTTNLHKQDFACYATRVVSLAQTEQNAPHATPLSSCTLSTRAIYALAPMSHTSIPLKTSASIVTSSAKHVPRPHLPFAPVAMQAGLSSVMIALACHSTMILGRRAPAQLVIIAA